MKRTGALLISGWLALGLASAPASYAAVDLIQPGDFILAPSGGAIGPNRCTLNFVFDGVGERTGEVYFATQAHCVGGVGASVRLLTGDAFGRVAFRGESGISSRDLALVEVLPSYLDRVDPAVKGLPGYPVGVADVDTTDAGDLIRISGQGNGFDFTLPSQEQRVGVLTADGPSRVSILAPAAARDAVPLAGNLVGLGPIVTGDDGAPIIHVETGTAAGMVGPRVYDAADTFCCHTGPTVPRILAIATAGGFPVTMRTV